MQSFIDSLLPVPGTDMLDALLDPGQVVVLVVDLVAFAQGLGLGHALADHIEDRCISA